MSVGEARTLRPSEDYARFWPFRRLCADSDQPRKSPPPHWQPQELGACAAGWDFRDGQADKPASPASDTQQLHTGYPEAFVESNSLQKSAL